jgi:hypothetical protein
MHPVMGARAVEVKQDAQQIEGGIAFAVQQDVYQFV